MAPAGDPRPFPRRSFRRGTLASVVPTVRSASALALAAALSVSGLGVPASTAQDAGSLGSLSAGSLPGSPQNPGDPGNPGNPGNPGGPVVPELTHQQKLDLLVRETNAERQRAGLPPVALDPHISSGAQLWAEDLGAKDRFGHPSSFGLPNGDGMLVPIMQTENVSGGKVEDAVAGWMNSPGHRANILDRNVTHVGFGIAPHPTYGSVIVQRFENVDPDYPTPMTVPQAKSAALAAIRAARDEFTPISVDSGLEASAQSISRRMAAADGYVDTPSIPGFLQYSRIVLGRTPMEAITDWLADPNTRATLTAFKIDRIGFGMERNRGGAWFVTVVLGSSNLSGFTELELVYAVNDARSRAGVPPLDTSPPLIAASRAWVARMSGSRSFSWDPSVSGRQLIGAVYGLDVTSKVDEWMRNPDDRAILLSRSYTTVGVGASMDSTGMWWLDVRLGN